MSNYRLEDAIVWGMRFSDGHPAKVLAQALRPQTRAHGVERDEHSRLWYVLDVEGRRLHGPYFDPPSGWVGDSLPSEPRVHTNHHRHRPV